MQILVDYQGRQIRLTDERLAHILEHPEMASMEAAIQAALSDPEVVRVSNTDSAVHLYYRYREGTIVGDKWLCVVVKYLDNDAFVITAYLTDKLKPIEAPLQHPRSLNVEKPRLQQPDRKAQNTAQIHDRLQLAAHNPLNCQLQLLGRRPPHAIDNHLVNI